MLNPVTAKKLYNTLVIPSMLHGCELWYPTASEMEKLERVHKMGAKRLQGMHFQTETNASLASLGMMPLRAIIDKHKLLIGTAWAEDYLDQYWSTLAFPSKDQWKDTVKRAISESEERRWREKINEHTCCPRLYKTHETNRRPHMLWYIAKKNPTHRENLQRLIHMCTVPVNQAPRPCPTCGREISDIIGHFLIDCPTFRTIRGELMDDITDCLGTTVAAEVHQQPEETFVEVVLGARVEGEVEPEQWENFIMRAARTMKPLGLMALKHTIWKW
ncbi:hypothetical protein Bbelb_063890 [Branchiostoma belcheri]|nr:hypothetical protein Bbelb_063890 [Branchiostoma belcheri]